MLEKEVQNESFFAIGRMVRSMQLLSISMRPSSRNKVNPFQRVKTYRIASAIGDRPETFRSCSSSQGLRSSVTDLLRD
jgi:hypothetical protein